MIGIVRPNVSILPRLATGISDFIKDNDILTFLFFPVLRRGSHRTLYKKNETCFYSSPSCDGDRKCCPHYISNICFYSSPSCDGDPSCRRQGRDRGVSILPRLATGINVCISDFSFSVFLFFPVLRRGSTISFNHILLGCFYSSPSCDGDRICSFASNSS